MRILIVEDDALVAKTLELLFNGNNYAIDLSTDGESALQMIESFEYDLILLDVLLPGLDGISLCHKLRTQGYQMPVLLLTGQSSAHQKAIALNIGADDYVVKPFDPEELIARVQALLRRGGVVAQPIMKWGALRLNPSSREVTYNSHALALTPKEYALLELFLRNSQRILSSRTILEHAWTSMENPGEETVRVHIKGLRQKLRKEGAPDDFIETIYRVGYRLKPLENLAHSASAQPQCQETVIHHSSDKKIVTTKPSDMASLPRPTPQATVMLVTSNAHLVTQIKQLLEPKALHIICLANSSLFWETLIACIPNVLILDREILEDKSVALCQAVRNDPHWQRLPILFLIDRKDPEQVNQIFAAGADDFISYPIIGPELVTRVTRRLLDFPSF